MFLINPNLIFGFLEGAGSTIWYPLKYSLNELTPDLIVKEQLIFPICSMLTIIYILNLDLNAYLLTLILITICTAIIILHKKLPIEKKFGYFALISLFLSGYIKLNMLIVMLSLILLLFIVKIENMDDYWKLSNYRDYIKNNFLLLIGLACISILYFMPSLYYLYRELLFIKNIPIVLMLLRWTVLYIIIAMDLYLLNVKNKII